MHKTRTSHCCFGVGRVRSSCCAAAMNPVLHAVGIAQSRTASPDPDLSTAFGLLSEILCTLFFSFSLMAAVMSGCCRKKQKPPTKEESNAMEGAATADLFNNAATATQMGGETQAGGIGTHELFAGGVGTQTNLPGGETQAGIGTNQLFNDAASQSELPAAEKSETQSAAEQSEAAQTQTISGQTQTLQGCDSVTGITGITATSGSPAPA